jgi:serine/threonine protein kinase
MIESLFTVTDTLHVGSKSSVVRAIRKSDGITCVIKSVRANQNSSISRAHARSAIWREYEVLKALQETVGVVRPLEHISLADGGAIVLRDSNGSSLAQTFHDITNQRTFLQIAMQVLGILGRVHLKHVVHKDLKPQNILLW